jgi:hypothetical protein
VHMDSKNNILLVTAQYTGLEDYAGKRCSELHRLSHATEFLNAESMHMLKSLHQRQNCE